MDITESTTANSRPLQLLAPIGVDSQEPVSFPLFILRDFEFLRLNGTEFHVVVDSQSIELAPFPVPLPMPSDRTPPSERAVPPSERAAAAHHSAFRNSSMLRRYSSASSRWICACSASSEVTSCLSAWGTAS